MLHVLQLRGLQNITGDLIIDDSLFEDETGTTADFDNRPYSVYNTFPDAALVNFQAQEFVVLPQKNNILVYADPPANNLEIRNQLQLVSGRCSTSALICQPHCRDHKSLQHLPASILLPAVNECC